MCFPFFHKYSKWSKPEWNMALRWFEQQRCCSKCGKAQRRYV